MPNVKKKKSTAQPKVFLIGFKTLGFFGCWYTKFAKVQRSHFNSNILHKLLFGMKVSERCLSYVKSYFQAHQLRSYVLMPIWESSRVRVLKQNISKKFSGERFKCVSVLHEQNIFKYIRKVFLFLDPKIFGLFPFLLVQGWEKSRITVWEQGDFKYLICIENLEQVPVYRKKISSTQ